MTGTRTPAVAARCAVQIPGRHNDGGRVDGAAARRNALHGPAGLDDPRGQRRVGEPCAGRGGALGEELRRGARQALGITRAPHRSRKVAGRGGHDLESLVGRQEPHVGKAVGVGGVAQFGGLPDLVGVRAEVEVAAEAQLELVAVLGDRAPDLERVHRQRQLGGLAPLDSDRALGAPGLLHDRSGLLLDHHDACAAPRERLRGRDAADAGADDDHIGATREIVLGHSLGAPLPTRGHAALWYYQISGSPSTKDVALSSRGASS
jgi:hypothetical protein